MSKFKVGDKVIMPKYVEDGGWYDIDFQKYSKIKINEPLIVRHLGNFMGDDVISTEGNEVWMPQRYFEKFIEPKFKVGLKFYGNAGGYPTEIVKSSLNKKKGSYSYMCFDLDDGYHRCLSESEIETAIRQKGIYKPEVVEEMTMDEVCKALGKKIKIKK